MSDDRRTCTECRHYRAQRCHNAILAQMSRRNSVSEVGRAFAEMKQRCNGFSAKETK